MIENLNLNADDFCLLLQNNKKKYSEPFSNVFYNYFNIIGSMFKHYY